MDVVKEYTRSINFHWIAVVGTGMYTYLRQICVIGLCFDQEKSDDSSYASLLFTFSVLCLIAEYRLWPRSLKEPPLQLLYVYEMLVAALATNLTTLIIWAPLMRFLQCLTQESSKWIIAVNSIIGLDNYSYLAMFSSYLEQKYAVTHMSFCMGLLSFVWMVDATESLDAFLDAWAK